MLMNFKHKTPSLSWIKWFFSGCSLLMCTLHLGFIPACILDSGKIRIPNTAGSSSEFAEPYCYFREKKQKLWYFWSQTDLQEVEKL